MKLPTFGAYVVDTYEVDVHLPTHVATRTGSYRECKTYAETKCSEYLCTPVWPS